MGRFVGRDLTCVRGERTVFHGLGFDLAPAGVLVLVGPNGSGKSSLLRLMVGLLAPTAGSVAWEGESIRDEAEAHRARLHYVGHLDPVKPVLTVRENLGLWVALKTGARDVDEVVLRALHTFGVGHLAAVPGRYLSAGQRRRVNLARVVASPAPLWLLDEPANGLDEAATARLVDAIADHRAGGGMVAVATHAPLPLEHTATLALDRFGGGPAP